MSSEANLELEKLLNRCKELLETIPKLADNSLLFTWHILRAVASTKLIPVPFGFFT